MNPSAHRPLPLVAVFAALAFARLAAADRAPEPAAAAEAPPAVSLPATAPAPAPETAPPAALATPEAKASSAKAADKKSAPKASASAPVPLSPQFVRVRDRIKALYGNRLEPPLAPDPRHNPFRTQATVPEPAPVATAPGLPGATPAETPPPPPAVNPNIALVKLAAAQLKWTGWFERDGRILHNLNGSLYKEGDVIKVTVQGKPVLLRASKVSRTSMTLTLEDAETTLRF